MDIKSRSIQFFAELEDILKKARLLMNLEWYICHKDACIRIISMICGLEPVTSETQTSDYDHTGRWDDSDHDQGSHFLKQNSA